MRIITIVCIGLKINYVFILFIYLFISLSVFAGAAAEVPVAAAVPGSGRLEAEHGGRQDGPAAGRRPAGGPRLRPDHLGLRACQKVRSQSCLSRDGVMEPKEKTLLLTVILIGFTCCGTGTGTAGTRTFCLRGTGILIRYKRE